MDPDRQPGTTLPSFSTAAAATVASTVVLADGSGVPDTPSNALPAPGLPESEEDPDSPLTPLELGTWGPGGGSFPDELLGPLLGPLIALLTIVLPFLCVLGDRRPDPSPSAAVLSAPLGHGSEPDSPISSAGTGEPGGGNPRRQPQ